jgi:hypothetical protein
VVALPVRPISTPYAPAGTVKPTLRSSKPPIRTVTASSMIMGLPRPGIAAAGKGGAAGLCDAVYRHDPPDGGYPTRSFRTL